MSMSIKKLFATKKVVAVSATVALTLGLSGAAFAYFSSTGTGAGTASVGSSSGIQLSSVLVGPLYPGATATPVTVNIHNPGTGAEYVGTISGTVTTQASCLGSWFTVAPVIFNTDVAGGASTSTSTTVALNDSGTNQDACQGLTMAIVWSSN